MAGATQRVQAAVDHLLQEQDRYEPLELLLYLGRLPYARYEAWRRGETGPLDQTLAGNAARALEQVQMATDWAVLRGLEPVALDYRGWGAHAGKALRLSLNPDSERLLGTAYGRQRQAAPQLDLFMDGGATAIVHDLCDALVARDPPLAETHLHALLARQPGHRLRPAAEQLCGALAHLGRPVADPGTETAYLETQLEPSAMDLLAHRARDFLAPFWRRIAGALAGQAFDPGQPRLHASWALARCLDWQAVVASLEGAEDDAVVLERRAEAFWRLGRRHEAIAAWCRLCWGFPGHAEALLDGSRCTDATVRALWQDFLDQEQVVGTPWFPAWLLLHDRGLARALPEGLAGNGTDPERAFRILQALLQVGAGAGEKTRLDLRRQLQRIHPGLLARHLAGKPR